ncbi:generic methyltransferase [Shewanella sediminis HAW-EB3]|uniref:Generic methyltransferase n=1 Tax=Shewanella sediminis (strain HAW-EB3) TaxID=425104 RepID=A8FVW8_SHESH|nr:class I SAM-dependent methyltransferase [Shewanella sediminis]ABV36991.1 generic methyltransferase [Shewanella sediminis HAW-EB3]
MEERAYYEMAKLQDEHWWFKGRRDIIELYLSKLNLPKNIDILEVGCGTGGNLKMLSKYGNLRAFELNDFSRKYASSISGICVENGWLPNNIPVQNSRFNLICMFDVLEHIENDRNSIAILKEYLSVEGKLVLTVPAFKFLFGKHDSKMHHFRRYDEDGLSLLMQQGGFEVEYISYFNTYLFPLAIISRLMDFFSKADDSLGSKKPHRCLNSVLYRIFRSELNVLENKKMPFGLSIICVGTVKQ